MLRGQVFAIILGTIFLFVGLVAFGIAAIRGRGGARILVWFGIFSAMYGTRIFAQSSAAFSSLPPSISAARPHVIVIITYLIIIPALLFWQELSSVYLRWFLRMAAAAALIVGMAGVYAVIFTDSPYRWMPYTNFIVILVLLVLAIVTCVPSLGSRVGIMRSRVSAAGTFTLAFIALYTNLRGFLHLPDYPFLEPLAFAIFVFTLAYVAAEKIFTDERRLLSIEGELAIARDIQNSILPNSIPEIESLKINAAYHPMTAVAGDFYEFISVGPKQIGILVADVSGHGVPAALISSMIKVAMQSLVEYAHQPGEVLCGLNRILSGQLRGQLISAAYFWLDTEIGSGLYSAAGHPPLLCWREDGLQRIESNGLLIGVLPDCDYPVRDVALNSGDRFLLYTDGVVEPENSAGDSFGDHKMEEVIRKHKKGSPSELSSHLLSEITRWQPASQTQQDDITLIIIDVARHASMAASAN